MILYEAEITEVGSLAEEAYKDGYIITFIDGPFKDFMDYCLSLEVIKNKADQIQCGDKILLDDNTFVIKAIGNKALENLKELGHVTIKFSGEKEVGNPGDINVSKVSNDFDIKMVKKIIISNDIQE